jgi:hypothetical protein
MLSYGDLLLSRLCHRSLERDRGRSSRGPRSLRRSGRSSRLLWSRLLDRCLRRSSLSSSRRLSRDRDLSRCRWRRSRSLERLRERCLLLWSRSSSLCLRDLSFFSFLRALSPSSPSSALTFMASSTSASCAFFPSGSKFALSLARSGTGKPIAASIASSSASFSLRFSSLIRSASAAFDSSSPLAYQFRSRPCCQRPTGAMSEWPR